MFLLDLWFYVDFLNVAQNQNIGLVTSIFRSTVHVHLVSRTWYPPLTDRASLAPRDVDVVRGDRGGRVQRGDDRDEG